ncbi:hypothetical protein TCAL_04972 [Tigriopus californicus]|uniref:Prokaryotic-type class I peptide chain release factors domain-containing protein n=1 Tax=Tigriopus californicus TaxID=6832 RepID=A0A553PDB5_TIGCA|nr:large ribosomal subunit protein mL62-like [Tigriopus californicus]TRY75671.1 hypothetical protein TCAL_04972 [Tigriopus californicus]|eukprot:TCALIF_04972-PA protein Name:"Similar to Ict1 Peptidyl-tRNA hydrolase ICT1, mitochondrial (Mus musculus)" AED:0.07 eAED:0.08 QI:0/-1/0/1/-1/1/1/0/194
MLSTVRIACKSLTRTPGIFHSLSTSASRKMEPYKSAIHPDIYLYPGSSVQDQFKTIDPSTLIETDAQSFSGYIPMEALTVRYTDSQGRITADPIRDSRVDIRFHLQSAQWLSDETKANIQAKWGRELTKDGFLVVKSDRTRSAMMNTADGLRKLREAIWASEGQTPPANPELELEIQRKKQIALARKKVKQPKV